MNIGALIVLLKLFEGAGLTKISRPPSDPTKPARPNCGVGKQAIWNESLRKWACVVEFD
jgi:hypothetical protein